MQNPDITPADIELAKIRGKILPVFNFQFPFGLIEKRAVPPFFPPYPCHIGDPTAFRNG
jgi:hypothetical protein